MARDVARTQSGGPSGSPGQKVELESENSEKPLKELGQGWVQGCLPEHVAEVCEGRQLVLLSVTGDRSALPCLAVDS